MLVFRALGEDAPANRSPSTTSGGEPQAASLNLSTRHNDQDGAQSSLHQYPCYFNVSRESVGLRKCPLTIVSMIFPDSESPVYGVAGCLCSSDDGSTVNWLSGSQITMSASLSGAIAPLRESPASFAVDLHIHLATSAGE